VLFRSRNFNTEHEKWIYSGAINSQQSKKQRQIQQI